MLYDLNQEPGHADVPCVHVPLEEYAPGSPRLERLYEQIELAKRFTFGDGEVNL